MPDNQNICWFVRANRRDQSIYLAQRNCHRLQMQLPGEGRGGLLRALQIGSVYLLNIRVGESFRETFGAPVSRVAEHGIGFIGYLVGVAHKKNGAHVLGVRTKSKHQRRKETEDSNS